MHAARLSSAKSNTVDAVRYYLDACGRNHLRGCVDAVDSLRQLYFSRREACGCTDDVPDATCCPAAATLKARTLETADRARDMAERGCDAANAASCLYAGHYALNPLRAGTPSDPAKAAAFLRRACLSPDSEPAGCRMLAQLFEAGSGVPKDLEQGKQLFRRACKAGDQPSCDKLLQWGEVLAPEDRPRAVTAAPEAAKARPARATADDDYGEPSRPTSPRSERRRWTARSSAEGHGSHEPLACSEAKAMAMTRAITACGIGGRNVSQDLEECRCRPWAGSGAECSVHVEISCESD